MSVDTTIQRTEAAQLGRYSELVRSLSLSFVAGGVMALPLAKAASATLDE